MFSRIHKFRSAIFVALVTVIGCAGLGKSRMRYLGETSEVTDLETPDGFQVSPKEARDIIRERHGLNIFLDHYYVDESNYYVINAFNLNKDRYSARKRGTMINGQTGEIFNRKTESWEPDPREKKTPN